MTTVASDSSEATPRAARSFQLSQEHVVLAVSVVVIAVCATLIPAFRTADNAIVVVQNSVVLALLGLGMAVVVIARGIDLSLVAIMAVSTSLSITMMSTGKPEPLALVVGLLAALGLGAFNGFLIAYVEIPALFATLATMLLFFNGARSFAFDSVIVYVPESADIMRALGGGSIGGVPVSVVVLLVVAVGTHLVLRRTTFGRFLYAHGDNPEAAAFAGIATRPLTMIEYAFAAGLAFVAGMVNAGEVASMDQQIVNSTLIFSVVLVVVLGGVSLVGGRGGVLSVVAGTLLVSVTQNAMTLKNVDNNYQDIVLALVLLGAILLDNRLHPRDEETARQGD